MARPRDQDSDSGALTVLGVDDWARRRGHTYGTVLVDLERRVPIDLLEDRTVATLAQWLRDHPGVEVIARDRAEAYAEGARQGAPEAVQVADRWHLLKNLSDLLERFLQRHRGALQEAADRAATPPAGDLAGAPAASDAATSTATPPASHPPTAETPAEQRRATRRAERQALYEQIHALRAEGLSLAAISARTGHGLAVVRKNLRATTCPQRAARRTKIGTLTTWDTHLRARWEAGCHDATVLWPELRAQGFRGTLRTVQRHVAAWRPAATTGTSAGTAPASAPRPRRPSPRQVQWWLVQPASALTRDQAHYVTQLRQVCPAGGLFIPG